MAARRAWCQVPEEPVQHQISIRAMDALRALGLLHGWEDGEAGSQVGSLSVTLLSPLSSLKNELFPI